jgi:hypothetical protein
MYSWTSSTSIKKGFFSFFSFAKRCRVVCSRSDLAVEVARDVEDDGDVLFECERCDLLCVFGVDLDVTLLVGPDVEDLELFFQPVVFAVGVDDEHGEVRGEQFLDDDRRRVRLPRPGFARDESAPGQNLDGGQRDGRSRVGSVAPRAGAHVRDCDGLPFCHAVFRNGVRVRT